MKQNRDKQREFSYAVVGCGMLMFIAYVLFSLLVKILF